MSIDPACTPNRSIAPRPSHVHAHVPEPLRLLLLPVSATGKLDGTFSLQKLMENGAPAAPAEQMSNISYEGPRVSRLRLSMPPVSTAGLYALLFRGVPANSEPLRFAVVSLPE